MYSVTRSFGLNGLSGFAVAVEADISSPQSGCNKIGTNPQCKIYYTTSCMIYQKNINRKGSINKKLINISIRLIIRDIMLKQKILEIIVIVLALLAIVFGISSCLYNDNVTILRIFSLIFIVIALILNFYSNYRKKKL